MSSLEGAVGVGETSMRIRGLGAVHELDEIRCNSPSPSPSPPIVDIVLFGLSLLSFPPDFKTHPLGRGFHTFIRNVSFPSLTDVGSHNPPP